MGELKESNEGQSAIPILIRAGNEVFHRIGEKYTERKPQTEAQIDAMVYAMVEYSNVKFDPRQPLGAEETNEGVDRWEKAINEAMLGNWEPMRETLRYHADSGWKASQIDEWIDPTAGPGEFLKHAEALHRLSQSL